MHLSCSQLKADIFYIQYAAMYAIPIVKYGYFVEKYGFFKNFSEIGLILELWYF